MAKIQTRYNGLVNLLQPVGILVYTIGTEASQPAVAGLDSTRCNVFSSSRLINLLQSVGVLVYTIGTDVSQPAVAGLDSTRCNRLGSRGLINPL